MVPLGPRLDFMTSWIPLAAEILTAKAWAARATSALGFRRVIDAIFQTGIMRSTQTSKEQE